MTPEQALRRIAEIDGPIECTSLQEWRSKVRKIAEQALNEERQVNNEPNHSKERGCNSRRQ